MARVLEHSSLLGNLLLDFKIFPSQLYYLYPCPVFLSVDSLFIYYLFIYWNKTEWINSNSFLIDPAQSSVSHQQPVASCGQLSAIIKFTVILTLPVHWQSGPAHQSLLSELLSKSQPDVTHRWPDQFRILLKFNKHSFLRHPMSLVVSRYSEFWLQGLLSDAWFQ